MTRTRSFRLLAVLLAAAVLAADISLLSLGSALGLRSRAATRVVCDTGYSLNAAVADGSAEKKITDYDNDWFTLTVKETSDGIRAVLHAKRDLTMKKFALSRPRTFQDNDRFFANGYQSWSTSEEKKKTDNTMKAIQLAKITDLTWQIAANNSDYNFATYGTPGVFHSWSLTYLRKAGSTDIEFYGSRNERTGFTMFDVDMQKGRFTIAKELDGLALKAGQDYTALDLYKETGEYDSVFDHYFFDVMKYSKPKVDRMTGYTSWYNLGSKITEETILRDLNGLDPAKDKVSIYQVDDGYEPAVGDWTGASKKFPDGMKYVADQIHAKGYQAGIWVAPFCAQTTSKVVREHPDWLVRDSKGKLVIGNGGWGGAFVLDIYKPAVRDYLRKEFDTILNDWGYDMVKLDFLYATAIVPRDGKTRGQLMAEGVDFLREICGDKIILGCGVPLASCQGVFDACRIGPDENSTFTGDIVNKLNVTNEVPSTRNGIANTLFRRFYNGRAFASDPDVFYLRDGIKYTEDQKLLLAKINDLGGSILFMSDNAGDYDANHMNILRQVYEPKTYKVALAEYTSDNDMVVRYTENGTPKTLNFNIATGVSNIRDVW